MMYKTKPKIFKSSLLEFHLSLKYEFEEILKEFNLLFYGFGCKQEILINLFPDAKMFNFKYQNIKDIIEQLTLDGLITNSTISSLKELDDVLFRKKKELKLILINFDFSDLFINKKENKNENDGIDLIKFKSLNNQFKSIKIIATIENIDISFDFEDLKYFNFIFRDLTTFKSYSDEIIEIDLFDSKVTNALMVFKSVPNKSKKIFHYLLSQDLTKMNLDDQNKNILNTKSINKNSVKCSLNKIFADLKAKLMIYNKISIIDNLNEFIDHGIVTVTENNDIILKLNSRERDQLLLNEELNEIQK